MENNEQNNIEATNNVNPVNNVEPTPAVEATPEVKTEDTIMVAEPAARPAVEPVQAPVAPTVEEKKEDTIMVAEPAARPAPAPAVEPTPAPTVQPQETVAQQPLEPNVAAEPEPVVIPKGEKPKKNNGIVAFLILILMILGICGYFVYDKYVKDLITKPNTNETSGNQANNVPEPTPDVDPTNDEGVSVLSTEDGIYEKMPIGDASIGSNLLIKNIRYTTSEQSGFTSLFGTHTFDVYLDNNLLVKDFISYEGLTETEYKGTFLNKIGVIKDTDTSSYYIVFAVGVRNNTLYIVDTNGQIVFQKDGTKDDNAEGFILNATNERFKTGDYKYINELDTNSNKNVDMILTYSGDYSTREGIVKSVKISSGVAVESVYKTYTSEEVSLTGR